MARGKLNRGQQAERQIRVGLVIVIAIALLGFGIFQVGRLFDVFASRYTLYTLIEGSGGLIEGAPVTLAGQRVGQVESIEFLPVEDRRPGDANIFVRLAINESIAPQIRRDSWVSLETQGLLGDRYVNIAPGSATARPLAQGDTLPSRPAVDYESVLRTAATVMDQVQDVVIDLRTLTESIAHGKGSLGALFQDDRLYEQMVGATNELTGLLRAANRSDGTLARLIRDPALYDRLSRSLARLDTLGSTLLHGDGALARMLHDDSLYRGLTDVVGRADSTLAGIEVFVGRMDDGEGTLARLMEDPELYDQFLKAVIDLQNLIQAIREDPSALSPEIRVF